MRLVATVFFFFRGVYARFVRVFVDLVFFVCREIDTYLPALATRLRVFRKRRQWTVRVCVRMRKLQELTMLHWN